MYKHWFWSVLCAVGTLAACSGSSGSNNTPDSGITMDAAADASNVDAAVNPCPLLLSAYEDLGAFTGTAYLDNADPEDVVLRWEIPLNEDTEPDVLITELWNKTAPESFPLNSDNGDVVNCSVCNYIAADFSNPKDIKFHSGYSGQLDITTLDLTPGTGKVAGRLEAVKYREVTIEGNDTQIVENGCRTSIAQLSFDFTVELAPETALAARRR